MWYGLLADLIVALHAAYVMFVVLGFFAILIGIVRKWQWVRNPWFRLAHLATILLVVMESACKIDCPLTVWEYDLRTLAGQEPSEATFMGRLFHHLLFDVVPHWMLDFLYLGFGLLVLATFVLAPPRRVVREKAA